MSLMESCFNGGGMLVPERSGRTDLGNLFAVSQKIIPPHCAGIHPKTLSPLLRKRDTLMKKRAQGGGGKE